MNKLIETTFLIICILTTFVMLYGFGVMEQMARSLQ